MYKLIYDFNGQVCSVQKISTTEFIPISEDNPDYQEFIKWNAEQETPLDLKSTIPVIPPEPSRDLAVEIDALKAKIKKLEVAR